MVASHGTSIVLLVIAFSALFAVVFYARGVEISSDVIIDSQSYGVIATLVLYAAQSSRHHQLLQSQLQAGSPFAVLPQGHAKTESDLDDIVVIQSESFFDARLLSSNIKAEVLTDYDALLKRCVAHGRLQVPAWGANTMRTEFAFLSGINPGLLGLSQYYPYQQLLNDEFPSLVSELKSKGYYCVCIHPHAAQLFHEGCLFQAVRV